MKKQEDFQNRALAHLLTERGVAADFERRAGRRRMDVVAEVEGLRVVLEAETGFHRKAQAIKDADARLRQKRATVVFAVCYPEGVTEDNLADATLTWTVRVKAGNPMRWTNLVDLARNVPGEFFFLPRTMMHEFAHTAGLGHAPASVDSIMGTPYVVMEKPMDYDKEGMKAIYESHAKH